MDNKTNCKDFEAKAPAAQRQWVGLTQEEQRECFQKMFDAEASWPIYADAIEAKLKEKNST
jgi:hypothetical protein